LGNRHILTTPEFQTGRFSMEYSVTFLREIDPAFTVYFRYDEQQRCSYGVRFRYCLSGSLELEKVYTERSLVTALEKRCLTGVRFDEDRRENLKLEITTEFLRVSASGRSVLFAIKGGAEKIALERDNFIGELLIYNAEFESRDDFEEISVLPRIEAEIPCLNGGDIPYRAGWEIRSLSCLVKM